jgi:hypothetical protein
MLRLRNIKVKVVFTLLLVLFFSSNCLFSQNQPETNNLPPTEIDNYDKIYGLDPTLYNGLLYSSFNPGKVKGDQYFVSSAYVKGEATIRGIKYTNIDLNFDIYKQEVLLKYLGSNNINNIIKISKAWLENFSIGDYQFVIYSTPENPKGIYQVIGTESIKLLYHWEKKVAYFNDYINNTSLYFEVIKDQYVLMNNVLLKFKNNNSFVHLFAKEYQANIRKYLHQHKIKVSSASDRAMEELINYCSKISIK